MEHERFIARRRARFDGIDGKVNIPYGTVLTCQDGFLMHKNQRVCAVGSQNGMDCFVQDDDGNGTLRGELVGNIQRCLERRDAGLSDPLEPGLGIGTLPKVPPPGVRRLLAVGESVF